MTVHPVLPWAPLSWCWYGVPSLFLWPNVYNLSLQLLCVSTQQNQSSNPIPGSLQSTQFLLSHIIQNCVQCIKPSSRSPTQFLVIMCQSLQINWSLYVCHRHCSGRSAWSGQVLYTMCTIIDITNPQSSCTDIDTFVPESILQILLNFKWWTVLADRNSVSQHCFMCTPMLHSIFTDCHSPNHQCAMIKLTGYWWEGSNFPSYH